MKYLIGGIQFTSKNAIREHTRTVLSKYDDNEVFIDNDERFIYDLFSHHRNKEVKEQTVGLPNHITVDSVCVGGWKPSRCLFLVGEKTRIDFSFNECIRCLGSTKEANDTTGYVKDIVACFRKSIENQIYDFKRDCKLTKEEWESYHVDHKSPMFFSDILIRFLKKYVKGEVVEFIDHGLFKELKSAKLHRQWNKYHRKHAVLRLLTPEENMKIKPKKADYSFLTFPN